MCALAHADENRDNDKLQLLRETCATHRLDFQTLCSAALSRREEPLWFLHGQTLCQEEGRRVLLDAMTLAFTGENYTPLERQLLDEAAALLQLEFKNPHPGFDGSVAAQDPTLVDNRLLDINNSYHRELAARLLRTQRCVAAQLSTTFALVSAATPASIEEMNVYKGRERDRVATLLLSPETLPALCAQVDASRVSPDVQNVVQSPAAIRYLSGAVLVRLPVVPGLQLLGQSADQMFLSETNDGQWLQLLCPADPPTLAFVRAAEASVGLLAATSMNDSAIGEETITSPRRALEFCQARDIGVVLLDHRVSEGSFKIIMFSESGLTIERDGRSAQVDSLLTRAKQLADGA